jgi:hypothetical protein
MASLITAAYPRLGEPLNVQYVFEGSVRSPVEVNLDASQVPQRSVLERLVNNDDDEEASKESGTKGRENVVVAQISTSLRRRTLQLYGKYLSDDSKGVNYSGLRTDPDFKTFVDATAVRSSKHPIHTLHAEVRL